MKGAIAAFVAACSDVAQQQGTLSLIITGDEEGTAVSGTRAIMDWKAERAIRPDMILIGEPTSVQRLGHMTPTGPPRAVNIRVCRAGAMRTVSYHHPPQPKP